MTGPLLFGPAQAAPTGVPAPAQRPAQSLRPGASDFAGSLRSATQRRDPAPEPLETPEEKPTTDEAPPADLTADETAPGEDDGVRVEDEPSDDQPVADAGDADDEQPDDADEAVAAPVAGAQRTTTGEADGSGDGETADGDAQHAARRTARALAARVAGGEVAADEQARDTARAPAAGATLRAEQAGAQQSGTSAQPGAVGSTGAILTGAETTGEQSAEQQAGQQGGQQGGARSATGEARPEGSGLFGHSGEAGGARGATEAAPADEPAPARPQAPSPTHTTGESVRPQTLRLESVATPAPSAGAAGRGAEAADDSAAMQAVHRGLGAAVRQRGGSVTIRLSPESMGQVRIEMTIRQGTVDVRFEASTEQARELLTRHADMLRTTLNQKGFGVERIDVHANPAPTNGSRAGADASADQQQRRSSEQDAAGGESRGAFGGRGDDRRSDDWRHDDEAQSFEQWRVRVNATA